MISFRIARLLAVCVWYWCTATGFSQSANLAKDQFVGSIPCDDSSRDFVGGISAGVPCHCITWRLTLSTNLNSNQRASYRLTAQYGLQGKTDPNQLEDGPVVELEGEWEILRGSKTNPQAVVYRLYKKGSERSVSLVRVGQDVLHFLSEDKSLRIGNAGWSYTLNRKRSTAPN